MANGNGPWIRTPVEKNILGWWEPPTPGPSTKEIEVLVGEEGRPDLLSARLWGSPEWWWVFALSDPDRIRDPLRDLRGGMKIRVPEHPPLG